MIHWIGPLSTFMVQLVVSQAGVNTPQDQWESIDVGTKVKTVPSKTYELNWMKLFLLLNSI